MGKNRIAGLILAGGENKRMHGRKKAFLQYKEKPFWKWIAEAMEETDQIYISVARKKDDDFCKEAYFEKFRLVEDLYEKKGPLGGILSGLSVCEEKALLVMPCDMIGCTPKIIEDLITEFQKNETPVFYKDNDMILPFPGIYTKNMISQIEEMIENGNYRLRDLIQANTSVVSFLTRPGIQGMLKNVNTLEEYEELLHDSDRGSDR